MQMGQMLTGICALVFSFAQV
ncbi:hypothetical protein CKAN_02565900 [Cinnamomum micranthum f. kanehirae]|uniref:Uncharacterized protein n=1 Tax=Cinnamomum micranthum f. kanehirae TaxID=337451 RepID=A0A3S3NBU2_9MAGN|nr:hypothetical protein CKAN_02565900 [Cinnamomum micranthum f. kanehirae]